MRDETKIYKIVGINTDNELVVCEYVFKVSNDFKGAVGYTMKPLYKEDIDSMNDDIDPEEMMESFISYIKENGQYDISLNDYIKMCQEEAKDYGRYGIWDDPSYRGEIKELIKNLSENHKIEIEENFGNDVVDWGICSGGRCLDRQEYLVIFEPDIIKMIQEYERED